MLTIQQRLGRVIQRRRREADYSQEAFADAVGLHRTHMGRLERGTSAATVVTLERIARTLGVAASVLLAEAERER